MSVGGKFSIVSKREVRMKDRIPPLNFPPPLYFAQFLRVPKDPPGPQKENPGPSQANIIGSPHLATSVGRRAKLSDDRREA